MQPEILSVTVKDFDLNAILDSGQCFRWNKTGPYIWEGVAHRRRLTVAQQENRLTLAGAGKREIPVWRDYFDLGRDYGAVKDVLAHDRTLNRAIAFTPGMRVLKQDPWETLCSFIVSQNNNIPRIKGILSRLCEQFGEEIGPGCYAFPPPERLAPLGETDLAPLRSGFRAAYILDASRRIAGGEIDLSTVAHLGADEARAELMKIKGVGPKVADCTLLYGFGKMECFPADVWIKRVLARFYPEGFPTEFRPYAGIAQQYLFYYARCCPECEWPSGRRA